jgi:hypothetical protein
LRNLKIGRSHPLFFNEHNFGSDEQMFGAK